MDQPSHVAIFDNIMGWGEDKEEMIRSAWTSPGGWEGWVQVELYYAFGYSATREDHAYEPPSGRQGQRTDFGFNSGPMVLTQEKIANESILLELKCEGANNKNFKDGVAKDLQKIEGGIKEEWWMDGGCTLYAIVLTMSEQGSRDMETLGMKSYYDSSTGHNPPFQLWWKMVHRPPNHFARQNEPGFDYRLASRRTRADRYYSGGPVSYDGVDNDSYWDN